MKRRVGLISMLLCMAVLFTACDGTSANSSNPEGPEESAPPVGSEVPQEEQVSFDWELVTDEKTGIKYWAMNTIYVQNPTVGYSTERGKMDDNDDYVQHMEIFVPESYLMKGADGTIAVNADGEVTGSAGVTYTAENAPIILHNTSGGYASSKLDGIVANYMTEGFVQVSIQTRGKEITDLDKNFASPFPSIVTDLKAGVRFLRHFDDVLPGNSEAIFSRGFSSGGAISAMLGASGNAPLFDPYLEEIGAYEEADDVLTALVYCPITNLNTADAAYEWFQKGNQEYILFTIMSYDYLGNDIREQMPVGPKYTYTFGGNPYLGGAFEDEMSAELFNWYVGYIQDLFGEDAIGNDGRSGPYFEDFAKLYADALTEFIRRYDEISVSYPAGGASSAIAPVSVENSYSDAYPTAQDYIDHLYADYGAEDWLVYDAATNSVEITDYDVFMNHFITRNKMCPSLDSYNKHSSEATTFRDADGELTHVSAVVRDSLNALVEKYETDPASFSGLYHADTGTYDEFTEEDYAYLKALADIYTDEVDDSARFVLDCMSPVNYIVSEDPDYQSDQAKYWRFQVGSADGDHGLPQAWATKWALDKYASDVKGNEIAVIWDRPHAFAEYTEKDMYDYVAMVMTQENLLD